MGGIDKAFLPLAGLTLMEHALDSFREVKNARGAVVVVPPARVEFGRRMLAHRDDVLSVVAGGDSRSLSVAAGLAHLPQEECLVAVHDAARPLTPPDLVLRVVNAAASWGAAVPIVTPYDTVKRLAPDDCVAGSLDRTAVGLAQTPQVFSHKMIREAYEHVTLTPELTDDSAVIEMHGGTVRAVPGDPQNIKVTTWADIRMAYHILAARGELERVRASSGHFRVGFGYDVHRLVEGRPLVMGGVKIPWEQGLEGHSDADVVCHAVIDALLGAAAVGDLGRYFPPGDERWKGAASTEMLATAVQIARAQGVRPLNVDVTIVAEAPVMAPYIQDMVENLAGQLGIPGSCTSIKATTTEGLGFTGRGLGIAAYAVASMGMIDLLE